MAETILIATLGGQPQIVTFALDALLSQGESITQVYLLHLTPPNARLQQSSQKLLAEFGNQQYQGRPCALHRFPILDGTLPLQEIRNERDAELAGQAIRTLLARLKVEGHKLHLCVAGGRRMLALLVTSAAMLLCDHQDRLWHMYTPEATQRRAHEGALMHAQPGDGVHLIPAPLVPWGTYFPALRAMALPPAQAVDQQIHALSASNELQCRQVYDGLTERQRDTLIAFVRGGTPQDVAEILHVSLSTVNSHKTALLAECRIAWELAEDARLDYRFLRERFAGFLSRLGRV
ncbi:MAG: histidine kinase [Caldilineaceae bacterium]|nr:histidine kinase [Caldilineaceae bacterium]